MTFISRLFSVFKRKSSTENKCQIKGDKSVMNSLVVEPSSSLSRTVESRKTSLIDKKHSSRKGGGTSANTRDTGATNRTALSLENHARSRVVRDDDSSLPTIDPDYNPTSSDFSLSDAGGTLGSQSQSLAISAFEHSAVRTAAFGSLIGDTSLEHGLYHDAYLHGRGVDLIQQPQQQPLKEETLEIYAPSGKLGVVIDVPVASRTPVVHAVKDTCPIRNELIVGDKLVAVDDEDVRDMTAIQVSRLISQKSGQPARKLTIIRNARGTSGSFGYINRRVHDQRHFGMEY